MAMSLSPTSSATSSSHDRLSRHAPTKPKKTRSRNGCPQCKAKRLKCDETRPACLMCLKAGRKCPGYNQEFRWSTKHERDLNVGPRDPPSSFNSLLSQAERVISISGDGSRKPQVTSHPRSLAHQPGHPNHTQQQQEQQDQQEQQPQQQQQPSQSGLLSAPATAAAAVAGVAAVVSEPPPQVPACPEIDLLSPGRHALGLNTPSPDPMDDLLQDFWGPVFPGEATLGDVSLYSDGGGMPLVHAPTALGSPFGTRRDSALSFRGTGSGLNRHPSHSHSHGLHMIPYIPRSIMDRSSMLIEEWFKHVCTIWSCFDSDANLNRKIACDSWTRSESVMNCMQSMAATCLSSQIPPLRQVAITSLKSAISCMKRELKAASAPPYHPAGSSSSGSRGACLPTELLLSLCCVGTAACWIDTKQLAAQFLREARSLIDRVNRESDPDALPPQDRQALSFFNNSIIYWDMLVAVVSDEEDKGILRSEYTENGAGQVVPHPWTGIAAPAQRLFARAIRLCRRFRRHLQKDSISTTMALRTALRDISEAQEIEEELLGLESRGVHEIGDTGDKLTPRAHLVEVAEGYRLASLLQLYQTFPDLVVRRLPEDAIEGDVVPWDRWIVPLSLRLVNTLRKVPPDSGTRCIQPLLYLTASTGLKFDVDMAAVSQQHHGVMSGVGGGGMGGGVVPLEETTRRSSLTHQSSSSMADPSGGGTSGVNGAAGVGNSSGSGSGVAGAGGDGELDGLTLSLESTEADTAEDLDMLQVPLTKHSIDVSHARRFILERLSALEHSLPPAPVRVAKDLVYAIWAAYDGEKPGMNHTHWIDVMEDLDLRTIFG